jgi:acetyl esterase/lipase
MSGEIKRLPFDPAYKNGAQPLNPDKILDIPAVRKGIQTTNPGPEGIAEKHPQYELTNIKVPGIPGLSDAAVDLALYQPRPKAGRKWPAGRPLVYHVHGGAQVAGDRYFALEYPMAHVSPADNVVFASIEYRLVPEHPAPAGAYDVYAGLVYLTTHAKELGIDPEKIVLYGVSGGAAVSASAALLSRKLAGPKCVALVLDIPMLDDRQAGHASPKQFWDGTAWPGWMEEKVWDVVLGDGDRSDPDGVRIAARAESLTDLPLTFIDIGECESMRDQVVAFASRIWRDGGQAELHVWPGVYHGGAMWEPNVPVSKAMVKVQRGFLERVFGLHENGEEKGGKVKSLL